MTVPDTLWYIYTYQGFFQDFVQGGLKLDITYYWGAKLYYIPESKAYDKLGESGIMLHCAKHNQHALHVAREVWGHVPHENFEK